MFAIKTNQDDLQKNKSLGKEFAEYVINDEKREEASILMIEENKKNIGMNSS